MSNYEINQIIRKNAIDEIIRLHKLWLENKPEGVKCNLDNTDLNNINNLFPNMDLSILTNAGK